MQFLLTTQHQGVGGCLNPSPIPHLKQCFSSMLLAQCPTVGLVWQFAVHCKKKQKKQHCSSAKCQSNSATRTLHRHATLFHFAQFLLFQIFESGLKPPSCDLVWQLLAADVAHFPLL